MPANRRKFSPQFKAEAVQLVLESDKPIAGGVASSRVVYDVVTDSGV